MRYTKLMCRALSILALPWLVAGLGCNGKQGCSSTRPQSEAAHAPVVLPGADVVLATVNGTPITQYQLDQLAHDAKSAAEGAEMTDERRRELLDKLIKDRAMAQLQDKAMSAQQRELLERELTLFRDRALVRRSLHPEVVPARRVREYYDAHPERFGARTIITCDLLTTDRPLSEAERKSFSRTVDGQGAREDWGQWAMDLKREGYPMVLRTKLNDQALHPSIRARLLQMKDGDASTTPLYASGRPILLRRQSTRTIPPSPLSQVEPRIRRTLAPAQFAAVIKRAHDRAMEAVEVEYTEHAPAAPAPPKPSGNAQTQ